jgi:hypothetical protein
MDSTAEIAGRTRCTAKAGCSKGTPAFLRDGLIFRTFSWANYDEGAYSSDLLLAIDDAQRDELLELVGRDALSRAGQSGSPERVRKRSRTQICESFAPEACAAAGPL